MKVIAAAGTVFLSSQYSVPAAFAVLEQRRLIALVRSIGCFDEGKAKVERGQSAHRRRGLLLRGVAGALIDAAARALLIREKRGE